MKNVKIQETKNFQAWRVPPLWGYTEWGIPYTKNIYSMAHYCEISEHKEYREKHKRFQRDWQKQASHYKELKIKMAWISY